MGDDLRVVVARLREAAGNTDLVWEAACTRGAVLAVCGLLEDRERLLEEAVAVLRWVESDLTDSAGLVYRTFVCCGNLKPFGHAPHCRLAAFLAKFPEVPKS